MVLLAVALLGAPPSQAAKPAEDAGGLRAIQREVERGYCSYAAFVLRGDTSFSGFGYRIEGRFYVLTRSAIGDFDGPITLHFLGNRRVRHAAELIGVDRALDVGVLRISDVEYSPDSRRLFVASKSKLSKGDVLLSLGRPSTRVEWKVTASEVLVAKYRADSLEGFGLVEHSAHLSDGEFGGPALRVLLRGGRFVVRKDGSISVEPTGRHAPTVAGVELVGMNVYKGTYGRGRRISYLLPAGALARCVRKIIHPAQAKKPGPAPAKPRPSSGTPSVAPPD